MLTTLTNQAYDGLVEKKAWDYYSLNSSDTKRSCRSARLSLDDKTRMLCAGFPGLLLAVLLGCRGCG